MPEIYYRFESLEVWKLARKFIVLVYTVSKKFPKDELFALTSQVRRAATSVALNIAEGSDRKSDVEFSRFLRIALGSVEEVITGLYIAIDLGYINQDDFSLVYKLSGELVSKIKALIRSLK